MLENVPHSSDAGTNLLLAFWSKGSRSTAVRSCRREVVLHDPGRDSSLPGSATAVLLSKRCIERSYPTMELVKGDFFFPTSEPQPVLNGFALFGFGCDLF